MPEYLTPGVYVEETSFRSRSIEGVPTSTFGMAGRTEYGPVPYTLPNGGPSVLPGPTLVTGFTEYERAFGGLRIGGEDCQLALAARAFFANGGRRLYVSRVFPFTRTGTGADDPIDVPRNFASVSLPAGPRPLLRWWARWPGSAGARISVAVTFRRGKNIVVTGADNQPRLTGVQEGAAVETAAMNGGQPPVLGDATAPVPGRVRVVVRRADGVLGYRTEQGGFAAVPAGEAAFHLTLAVTVRLDDRVDVYNELELDDLHPRSVGNVLQAADPADEFSLVRLETVPPAAGPAPTPGALLAELLAPGPAGLHLDGGGDGRELAPQDLAGKEANPDSLTDPALGLGALAEIDDIAIVATPDTVTLRTEYQKSAVDHLIGHCERLRYRIAIVDPPRDSSISEVRRFRAQFDTKYAALYYPWVKITDPGRRPEPGAPPPVLEVPPSGYVAGIYARSDTERGVHKAPANEVLLGVSDFTANVTYDRQSVLNPEGINALRFFEGRARRVWGARTMSSDPEWKYVNVRRLFIYLEHSIEKSTQWAVFEPNNERLWASIRQTVEDFLFATWRTGALLGTKPEEAFFVRCDRTTMTQNDLDNGRLICLIGVAPTYPAEFVVFRIGQFTADAQRS
ncbi:phage tail sheath subtilisin-like domain-containing protein [Streptomyces sp. NPDC032472]|uniref:phage tail sheath family protein n=1 Tax=Streptomyces sp. NPDC032472 TaxID=3155018 RepID=UPI0033DFC489